MGYHLAAGRTRRDQQVNLKDAQAIIDHIVLAATSNHLLVSISVVDEMGNEIATTRMDGARWFTPGIARAKAGTAALMGTDTAELGGLRDQYPEVFEQVSEQLPFTPTTLPGGVFVASGGAIGVSGATPEEDVELAKNALDQTFSS
jgi:glc operon protein GlcG